MELKTKTERLDAAKPEDVARAAEILRSGGTVAFPTETVYGLGANALSDEAVAKIFEAKQRPNWDPLIVHICNREMLERVVAGKRSRVVEALIEKFWPGPLTLLLPRTEAVPGAVTAGRPLVGVRMPAHSVALELIRLAGVPIAAPSANTFGHTSPTTAAHVLADLDGRIDAVLDGGPTVVGVESTVAEVADDGVLVYRPGGVTLEMLTAVVGQGRVSIYELVRQDTVPESLPSPGVGIRHYAPRARLLLVDVPFFRFTGLGDTLIETIAAAVIEGETVGVMLPDEWTVDAAPYTYPWGPWSRQDVLARRLFAGLRALDDAGVSVIVCPVPHGDGMAAAIRDRLAKAAK